MLKNKNSEVKQLIITPRGFSNLIFNHNNRAISALTNYNSPIKKSTNRQLTIMLLKKKRKLSISRDSSPDKGDKHVQHPQSNNNTQMNIINFMAYNPDSTQKLKSNYCKKITLTNVDKYYQFCLKKVKDISKRQQPHKDNSELERQNPFVSLKRSQTGVTKPKASKVDLSGSLSNSTNNNQQKNPYESKKEDISIVSHSYDFVNSSNGAMNKIIQARNQSCCYLCSKHQEHIREIQSSSIWRYKNPEKRRYLKSSAINDRNNKEKKKSQFIIDPWEAIDNAEDFF